MTENSKKNPDYSESAENLCNPKSVEQMLGRLQLNWLHLQELKATLRLKASEIVSEIEVQESLIDKIKNDLKEAIDVDGSYQDIEKGIYAVKYRKISKTYDVDTFMARYPQYTPAVVVQTVNVKALEGLIKGGLIIADDLKKQGITREEVSYAYYIR